MLHVSCSRVKGREMIHRFRFGEISLKLVSIEKNVVTGLEIATNMVANATNFFSLATKIFV